MKAILLFLLVPTFIFSFDEKRAFEHLKKQVSFGARTPESASSKRLRKYISKNLSKPHFQEFSVKINGNKLVGVNILGTSYPKKKRRILLATHYDTRAVSDKDEEGKNEPVLGANDGASGVAILLELENILKKKEPKIYGVDFAFFDLEDQGNYENDQSWALGSKYFVSKIKGQQWEKVIVVDMVGDADLNIYKEYNSSKELVDEIWSFADSGFHSNYKYAVYDDHIPFLRNGFKAALIIDFDYKYWHTTNDVLENVSAGSLKIVGKVLEDLIFQESPIQR